MKRPDEMGCLAGRRVVITGAGRGLGAAYAEHAAACGAMVVVNDIDADMAAAVANRICRSGGEAVADDNSVAEVDGAAALIERCVTTFGGLDGLVNNAGLFHLVPTPGEVPQRVRELMDVNVLGPLWCGVAAIPHLQAAGGGAIVNVTSGAHLGIAGMAAYGASKGAVASLTYCWAAELAADNIRVNAVSPVAGTRMTAAMAAGATASIAAPNEVAALVSYLLSDLADFSGSVIRLSSDGLGAIIGPRPSPQVVTDTVWTVDTVHAAVSTLLAADPQIRTPPRSPGSLQRADDLPGPPGPPCPSPPEESS